MSELMLQRSPTDPGLEELRVADAMHPGAMTCPLETPLRDVARMMARYRIHAVIVFGENTDDVSGAGLWGVVSDLDLVEAAAAGEVDDRTAGGTAVTPALVISGDDTVALAAQLMSEYAVTHLVVVDEHSQRPRGVLSTLDVARVLADS
jgi:CBS domain-containing protein